MNSEQNLNEDTGGGSALNVQLYRVAWKSKLTEATGHGSPISFEIADAAVKDANKRLGREIDHWIEAV